MSDNSVGDVVGGAVVAVLLNFWLSPAHSHTVGLLNYKPDPGYQWAERSFPSFFRKAVWTPGSRHPRVSLVFASESEGYWTAADGYDVLYRKNQPVGVGWRAGRSHSFIARVRSTDRENHWRALPGYAIYSKLDPQPAPVTETYLGASDAEALQSTYYETRWTPGLRHPDQPHISSNASEGWWTADPGYHFIGDGSLEVAPNGPDWGQFWTGVAVAVFANGCAQDRPDDGAAATYVGRPLCREVRNQAAGAALDALN